MYLASIGARSTPQTYRLSSANTADKGTGILSVYANSQPESSIMSPAELIKDNAPYFAISVSLNLLLTLMIVVRLILYRRNIKNAMGGQAGVGGLYKTIATIMVESSALYAITYLLFIGSWAADISVQYIFLQALGETQVRTVFFSRKNNRLIVLTKQTGHRSLPHHPPSC